MTPDDFVRTVARACHEINRVYCDTIAQDLAIPPMPPWAECSDAHRAGVIAGVRGALAGNSPEQSHQSWLASKALDGWKYGPVKDEAKKEHPRFVAYDKLPPAQKVKDALFVGTVRLFASLIQRSTKK